MQEAKSRGLLCFVEKELHFRAMGVHGVNESPHALVHGAEIDLVQE